MNPSDTIVDGTEYTDTGELEIEIGLPGIGTTPVEIVVVEAADYAAGKANPQIGEGLAEFFEGTPKIQVKSVEEALQDPQLLGVDYSFLPVYLVKKTKANRAKVEQHIKTGAVQETKMIK